MESHASDFVVVGGGIGGLATALQIARRDAGTVTVLERAQEFGEVTRMRVSGILIRRSRAIGPAKRRQRSPNRRLRCRLTWSSCHCRTLE
jgi:2-polyprenyl-6-methoxyphenol hydroxylase-like FAD-dependent oxidoreductase